MKYWPSGGWALAHTGALTRKNTVIQYNATLASNENATCVTYSIDIYQHIPTNKISKLWHQLYFITLILERFQKQKSAKSQ